MLDSWTQRGRVHLLSDILVTADTFQSPITPYELPGVASEAAKVGQDPSAVSPKHPPVQVQVYTFELNVQVQVPTAAFKAVLFAGANTAPTTSTTNNVAANTNHTIQMHARRPPVRVWPRLVALLTNVILSRPAKASELVVVWTVVLVPSSRHATYVKSPV